MSQSVTEKEKPLQVLNASARPHLLISDNFYKQAEALCKHIPNVEWSGIVLYNVTGSLTTLLTGEAGSLAKKEFFIEALDIIPMDKGSAAYTTYKFGPPVIKYLTKLATERGVEPKSLYGLRIGHIHSHVNMSTTFSPTDDKELRDNIDFHNGYLSIITNNKLEYNVKYAVKTKMNRRIDGEVIDIDGTKKSFTKHPNPEELMLVYSPDINFEDKVINFENTFLDAIKEIKEKDFKSTSSSYSKYPIAGGNHNHIFNERRWDPESKLWLTKKDLERDDVEISGNVIDEAIVYKVSTTSDVFMNFIKDFLVESYYFSIAFNKASDYTLHKILADINSDYKVNKDQKKRYIPKLKAQIEVSYLSIMGELSDDTDAAMFVNDLVQVIAVIDSNAYKKLTVACGIIKSVCRELINEYKNGIKTIVK